MHRDDLDQVQEALNRFLDQALPGHHQRQDARNG
jgi:hypothetical protein